VGAKLGATGTNNPQEFWTYMNNGQRHGRAPQTTPEHHSYRRLLLMIICGLVLTIVGFGRR
jgi:hypothetical protein